MTDITISLDVAEEQALMDIDHVIASLQTLDPLRAKRGIVAAAKAKVLCELVIQNAETADTQVRRFMGLHEQSAKLLNSYWTEFGFILLKRSGDEAQVAVRVADAPRATPVIKHVGSHNKGGKRQAIEPARRQAIVDAIRSGPPSDVGRNTWFETIAADYHVSPQTVYNWAAKLKEQNGTHHG